MNYEKLRKRLSIERHISRQRGLFAIDTFHKKIIRSLEVLRVVEEKSRDSQTKKEARKNFIINCITAAECYFKDVIKDLLEIPKIQKNEKIKELLKAKITLWDVYSLFKEKPRMGELIIVHYLFENLEVIDHVMSRILLNKDTGFLKEIENYEPRLIKEDKEFYEKKNLILKKDLPDWKRLVSKIFNLRHEYVHHISFTDRLSYRKTEQMMLYLFAFIDAIDYFILGEFFGEESNEINK